MPLSRPMALSAAAAAIAAGTAFALRLLLLIALALIREQAPELDVDGEMHGDAALDAAYRRTIMPRSTLSGEANLLVMPNIEAANISYNLLKTAAGNNVAIGPILLGAARPVHIVTASATVRRIVNMTALTVLDANQPR